MSSAFWHPFADMSVVATHELVLRSGDGIWVEDAAGHRYMDATGGLWYCSVGHGREEIAAAAADQMSRLAAYSAFGPYVTEPTLQLAERLAGMSPIEDAVVFFTSGGSEAVDSAAKLARRYWHAVGRPERNVIVAREHAYHGMNAYGTALAGIPGNMQGYGGALIEEVAVVPFDDVDALEALLTSRAGEIAAVFGEPVIGAGGVYPPSADYWESVSSLCQRHDVLLIADEVISGFGRLGERWGTERFSIRPDIVTFAKGVTSGYVPLGGLLIGPRVQEPFWDPSPGHAVFKHGYTYSGHATACATAMANLDVVEREGLIERVRELEPVFTSAARSMEGAGLVGEVRAIGLMAAIELSVDAREDEPDVAERVVRQLRERGVLTRTLGGRAIQVSPAFVISEAEIGSLFARLGDTLTEERTPASA